jgi:hypothetical protein
MIVLIAERMDQINHLPAKHVHALGVDDEADKPIRSLERAEQDE